MHTGDNSLLRTPPFPPPDWLRPAAYRRPWECCQLVAMEEPCVFVTRGVRGGAGWCRRWGGTELLSAEVLLLPGQNKAMFEAVQRDETGSNGTQLFRVSAWFVAN